MGTLRFSVADADAGTRLDKALAIREEIGSRSLAERLLSEGAVRVDGAVQPKSHKLDLGSIVEVELPGSVAALEPEPVSVPVLYEDEHLIVLDKPAGLVVHPGAGERTGTLAGQLLTLGASGGPDPERPGIVHRLDRDTSGLLVVARSDEAHSALQEAIRQRNVERLYLALVRGHPRSRAGRIEAPIGRDRRDPTKRSLDTNEPREAVTRFEVRELLAEHTLLDVRLETGRTHQIRVHLAAIDLPVAGDAQYGVRGDLGLVRQFLHAHRLSFRHPVTGAEMDVVSPLPSELETAHEAARVL
ncbi:MAG: RluA family pseudouridine synthase [Gaiellaceae bacterium]